MRSMTRRQIILSAAAVLTLALLGGLLWVGIKAKRTADNVAAMVVPPRVLPTATAAPTAARPAPTAAPGAPTAAPAPPPATLPPPTPPPAREPDGPGNGLSMGYDQRPNQRAGRTDAMIVVRLDPRRNRASILSFPRDLWVNIPGHGQDRINAAYAVGELDIGPGYGAPLAKQTVSELLGLPIDYFVLMHLDGFRAAVDKIGGIDINIPRAVDDPAYPTADFGTIKIHFDPGCQHLDGERALQYARTRHQDNDFGRNQRQQQVMLAIFNKIRAQGLLINLTTIDEYSEILRDYVRTDMPVETMLGLARAGARLTAADIHRYAIDSHKIYMLKPPATFAVDPADLKALVAQFTGAAPDPTPVPAPVAPGSAAPAPAPCD